MYKTIKTFGNDRGFSCCFRQHAATDSHCSQLHGYSLGFEFTVVSKNLDHRNWVYDFGGFKRIKNRLEDLFDHTLVVAKDDPEVETFLALPIDIARVYVFEGGVGCEKFAELMFKEAQMLIDNKAQERYLESVKVFEHGANAAIYSPYEENHITKCY